MQKKSAIRTKPILQRTKETSNCCGGLRFPVSSSQKVYGSPNSENWNLARPRYTKNLLWVGSSRFFARERSERARSTDAAVRKRKNARSNKRVRKCKQPKTYVPPQRFSVQQRCRNNAVLFKNSATPPQQR